MEVDIMSFADSLKAARKKAELTQKELATELKVTPAMIAQYETGKRVPRKNTLSKLAEALHMKFSYTKEGEPFLYSYQDGDFYGIEASPEEQQKFMERLFNGKNEVSDKRKALDKKIDQFNDDGIQKMSDYADDIIKIPEYRKGNE